jgi:pimeloyl-ACP methyl ester carboxylesterase
MLLKNISYQNATIFYRITGAGKPVVLLHGFGEDGDIWKKQIDFLKDYFTLIIPDLPGSGKSDVIADMSIEGMAESIKAIMDFELPRFLPNQLGTEGVTIIGHSMGGYIALAIAEKYPSLVNKLGLFHSSAFADSEEKKTARLKSIDFIQNNGAYEFLKTAIPGLFFWGHDGSKPSDPYIEALIEKSKNFTSEALVKYYQAMIARPDRTAVLKNFLHPILFIIGEHDQAVPFAQGLQQSYLPNLSYIIILRNSAHMGMWEEADKANVALLQFLQGQPG